MEKMFVATVVHEANYAGRFLPREKSFCAVAMTKDEVVKKALACKEKWERMASTSGVKYTVVVGELTQKVVVPMAYELEEIK
jgi:hypothetical protein